MRALRKNQDLTNDTNDNTTAQIFENSNILPANLTDIFKSGPSFVLSTEICMYIHGALIASIFIIGLIR